MLLTVGCASPGRDSMGGVGGGGGLKVDLGGHLEPFDLAGQLPPDMTMSTGDAGAKDLSTGVDLSKPPDMTMLPPATCTSAIVLPEAMDLSGDTTGQPNTYDYGVSPSAACSSPFAYTYDGPDLTYSFTIAAGKTLKVTVTQSGGWDAAVGIVTNCAMVGPSCLAGSDNLSGNESASYKNTGATPMDVFVIVDSYLPSEYGKFTIRADVL
jgi:hypothetical protein